MAQPIAWPHAAESDSLVHMTQAAHQDEILSGMDAQTAPPGQPFAPVILEQGTFAQPAQGGCEDLDGRVVFVTRDVEVAHAATQLLDDATGIDGGGVAMCHPTQLLLQFPRLGAQLDALGMVTVQAATSLVMVLVGAAEMEGQMIALPGMDGIALHQFRIGRIFGILWARLGADVGDFDISPAASAGGQPPYPRGSPFARISRHTTKCSIKASSPTPCIMIMPRRV